MKSKELCTYLERLRSARAISQESFTNEIVSLRQYRRYLKGESDIPFQIIHQLAEKLSIKTDNLLREFEVAKVEETDKINRLYNYAVNYAHDEFKQMTKEIPLEHIIDSNNKLLYRHSEIFYLFYTSKITKTDAATQNIELINYPKILDQLIITSVEMLVLSNLLDFLETDHHQKIIKRLQHFFDDSSIVISGANDKIFPLILIRLAKYSGVQKNYDEVINYCELGIQRNLNIKSYYLMDYFYYYSAVAFYEKKEFEKHEQMLLNCYNVLYFEGNKKKIEKFTTLIEKDFKIRYQDFVLDSLQKLQK